MGHDYIATLIHSLTPRDGMTWIDLLSVSLLSSILFTNFILRAVKKNYVVSICCDVHYYLETERNSSDLKIT